MNNTVLLLNADYEPLSVCSPQRAVRLMLLGKVDKVEDSGGFTLRSSCSQMTLPGVLKLNHYRRVYKRDIPITKRNVIRRDGSVCQYCGDRSSNMTIDHVIPKSRGGRDSWDNLVCACPQCNAKKGDRTPAQAQMLLKHKPKRPRYFSFAMAKLMQVPEAWRPYLFMS